MIWMGKGRYAITNGVYTIGKYLLSGQAAYVLFENGRGGKRLGQFMSAADAKAAAEKERNE